MAKILILKQTQYFQGGVQLYRGDAWNLLASVQDNINGVNSPVDLSGADGATGYFPADDGGEPVTAVCEIYNGEAGQMRIPLTRDESPLVALNPNGISVYVVVEGLATDPFTAAMPENDVNVLDRGFNSGS